MELHILLIKKSIYSTTNRCITTLFCIIDNYCKIYEEWGESKLIPSSRKRKRLGHLSLSELLTIVLYFYISPCKDFKNYYLYHLSYKYRGYFSLPSYSRIIHLWSRLVLPLTIMLQLFTGEEIGIYFIDSSRLSICHAKRTNSNKVFSGIAKIGMSSYGWCMGFKLHIIVNNKGQIMAIKITKGNASDVSAVDSITKRLCGKLFGDKAYISKEVSAKLFSRGLRLFTGIRKDMKNHLLDIEDKILLRRKSTIESVFNVLKNGMNLEHTRHRSPINFLVHILACLNAFKLNKSRKFVAVLADSQTLLS